MAIRFNCGSCSQPIEVDDEWALRTVACPYCRKTITAPAESTLTDLAHIPTASALPSQPLPESELPATEVYQAPAAPNRVAMVALALALAAFASGIAYVALTYQHSAELQAASKEVTGFQDLMKVANKITEANNGTVPTWFMLAGMFELVGGAFWIAALVCGIIGVRHPHRRELGVTALIIIFVTPVLLCCGSGIAMGLSS